jgi:hypothetical protein
MRHSNGKRDGRYSIQIEATGADTPRFVVRFCGERIGDATRPHVAQALAVQHSLKRAGGQRYGYVCAPLPTRFCRAGYVALIYDANGRVQPDPMAFDGKFYGDDGRTVRAECERFAKRHCAELNARKLFPS